MSWTYHCWHSDSGCRPALAGPVARTRFPVIYFDDGTLQVVLRMVPANELRFMRDPCDSTSRDPVKRFRSLARRAGANKAAREALGL